jgi:hypothetical protein
VGNITTDEQVRAYVRQLIGQVPDEIIQNFVTANRKYLTSFLGEDEN